jgi:predicted nucleic acid-binding protein
MANSVFLDTNGWIALLHLKDVNHAAADGVWRKLGANGYRVVVTDWVIAETGNGLARTGVRTRFADAVDHILTSPSVDVIAVDAALLKQSLDHYRRHADKIWGLVDCSSFLVMQERGMTEAFTSDRHFEQAGFHCLLSPE